MAVENNIDNTASTTIYVDSLVKANPDGSNSEVAELDNHVRGLKNVLLNTLTVISGPITATHTELNKLTGMTRSTAELNDLATVTGTETLTNKTLDNPTVTNGLVGETKTGTVTLGTGSGRQTNTVAHGLGTDDLDVSIMVDADQLTGVSDHSNVAAVLLNANGEVSAQAGAALTLQVTSADKPSAGNLRWIAQHSTGNAVVIRYTARKRTA